MTEVSAARQALADVLAMRGRTLIPTLEPPPGMKWWTRPCYYTASVTSAGVTGDWRCAFCGRVRGIACRQPGYVCSCGAVLMPNWDQMGFVPADYDGVEIYG